MRKWPLKPSGCASWATRRRNMSEKERAALQRSLLELSHSLPEVQVQNRLMGCTDRDLALALDGMSDDEIEELLSRIAGSKAARVREEVRLEASRHVESRYSVAALQTVIRSLESNRSVRGQRSYFRPRRQKRDLV